MIMHSITFAAAGLDIRLHEMLKNDTFIFGFKNCRNIYIKRSDGHPGMIFVKFESQ